MGKNFTITANEFPDLPKLMLAVIEALRALGGSANVQELVEQVVEMEKLSEKEQSILMPNGRDRRLNYYLSWSRTFLKRGDALVNSKRGVWALTDVGEQITSLAETEAIHKQVNAEERERAKEKRQAKSLKPTDGADSEGISEPLEDGSNDEWEYVLLDVLLEMPPDGFERLAQRLLREAGFTKVEVRGKSGDGGIDGVGVLRVNLVSFQVYFQCKRWKNSVGAKDIRDFRGALQGRADKGLFITTGTFTSQASEEATRDGAIAIDLIDGARLCELLKQYDLGVRTETVERVSIIKDWFAGI